MSARAYTMKEMKAIVEYLVEHKAYSEIKGRKMWMDMSSSNATSRTWQSLKETFLKRILPDINNPYYNLSVQQISSFKHGQDIEGRLNNKLEIQITDGVSNNKDDENNRNEQGEKNNENYENNEIDENNENDENVECNENNENNEIDENNKNNENDANVENNENNENVENNENNENVENNENNENNEKNENNKNNENVENNENNEKNENNENNENSEDQPTGEAVEKVNAIDRDSTDTLILECSPETADDSNKDLQIGDSDEKNEDVQPKSVRDLITYTEPLDTTLQNTLEDFASDEEESNGEPQMQIVETEETAKKDIINDDDVILEILDSDSEMETNDESEKRDLQTEKESNKNSSDNESEKDESSVLLIEDHVIDEIIHVDTTDSKTLNGDNQKKSSEVSQNSSTITESIPNNQEALQKESEVTEEKDPVSATNQFDIRNRKRASSHDIQQTKNIKKRNLSLNKGSMSDFDVVSVAKDRNELNPKNIAKKLDKLDESNKSADKEMVTIDEENEKTVNQIADTSETVLQDIEMTPEIENPRLDSVSLHEGEVAHSRNKESQKKIDAVKKQTKDTKKEQSKSTKKARDRGDVVLLESHSESMTESESPSSKTEVTPTKKNNPEVKRRREKANDDVYGTSRGGAHRKRKRSYYKHSKRRQARQSSSDSSDFTSDSDSEYIPRRRRKHRRSRKYLKPKSGRIFSLEEDGGLFVMYGKKIYPLVKDGKLLKEFVTFHQNDADREESFWKQKYEEEKKRTDELIKLLQQTRDKSESDAKQPAASTSAEILNTAVNQLVANQGVQDTRTPESSAERNNAEFVIRNVKVKFTRNNQEVQLEGDWSHVNPVLSQVMQALKRDANEPADNRISRDPNDTSAVFRRTNFFTQKYTPPTLRTGNRTGTVSQNIQDSGQPITTIAIEDDVVEKVNMIENDIFDEIENRRKREATEKTKSESENISKGRSSSASGSIATSSTSGSFATLSTSGSLATPTEICTPDVDIVKDNQEKTDKNDDSNKTTDKTSPKKKIKVKTARTRVSLSRKSKEVNLNKPAKKSLSKLPTPQPVNGARVAKNTKKNAKYLTSDNRLQSSPESRSLCSIDSTQGYQDTDESTLEMYDGGKRKLYTSTTSRRGSSLSRYRTNSHPFPTDDITSESSNSFQSPLKKTMIFKNSTSSSEACSSDSYRLLMNKTLKNSLKKVNLEKIVESPNLTEHIDAMEQSSGDVVASDVKCKMSFNKHSFKIYSEEDSTSNVSLPTSPVLSIVENMSISKDLLSAGDYAGDDYMQTSNIILNDFIKSKGNVSMPLMEQDCNIETSGNDGMEYHYNLRKVKDTSMSETIVNEIKTINIQDPTLTDTINTKLKNLILESAKKSLKNKVESDLNNNIDNVKADNVGKKRKKPGKLSSTPRKRKNTRKLTLVNNEPCIDEHTDSCSYSRKSCPPVVQNVDDDNLEAALTQNQNMDKGKTKGRVKKDIIKVKITRPKSSKVTGVSSSKALLKAKEAGMDSVSRAFVQSFNDSIDLIHNHSETCLNAHDCMGDSVEFVQDTKSVISLDSTKSEKCTDKNCRDMHNLEYDLFSQDAQDGSRLVEVNSPLPTAFHTPIGSISENNSLITEDLSELSFDNFKEPSANNKTKPNRWYLLSEDETTNTNYLDINQNSTKRHTTNLEQLFPVICTVPNLSTITENSNQNDESVQKLSDEMNTKYELDSQSK